MLLIDILQRGFKCFELGALGFQFAFNFFDFLTKLKHGAELFLHVAQRSEGRLTAGFQSSVLQPCGDRELGNPEFFRGSALASATVTCVVVSDERNHLVFFFGGVAFAADDILFS